MRVINRPLALVLAAALVVASVIVIIEVIAFAVHAGPVALHWPAWYRWAARTSWNALVIKVWSVILIIAGAIVLGFIESANPIEIIRPISRSIGPFSRPGASDTQLWPRLAPKRGGPALKRGRPALKRGGATLDSGAGRRSF